jgi:hypothetical protein
MSILDLDSGATLQSLIDAVAEEDPVPQTGVERSAAIELAITDNDIDELMALQGKMVRIIDTIVANHIDPDHFGLLTPAELHAFMVELLDQKDLKRLIEVRYPMLRAAIFAHITAVHRLNKVKDPEHTPGEAEVPGLAKKFVRQGGGAINTLDFEKLEQKLGKKRWAKVWKTKTVPAVTIPAHTEEYLDERALVALVNEEPELLDKVIKKCTKVSGYGQVSFHVKPIK